MNRMHIGLLGTLVLAASARVEVEVVDDHADPPLPRPEKKKAAAVRLPDLRPEPKEKSESLKRMLGCKGRARSR